MKYVPLTQGYDALVDDEDYEWLSQWNWYYHDGYAVRNITTKNSKQTQVRMHRELVKYILGVNISKEEVDHRDRNKLNNTRNNLRIASRSQNMINKEKQDGHTSIYKGVSWNTASNAWVVQIGFNNTNIGLGYFDDEEVAANVYNHKAKDLFGDFAWLNEVKYIPIDKCMERKRKRHSKYRGVTWVNKDSVWYVMIGSKYYGTYYDELEAALAYNKIITSTSNCTDDIILNDISMGYSKDPIEVKQRKKDSSNYTGVSFRKDSKRWRSYIRDKNGNRINIGTYDTEIDAALAYNKKAFELFGEDVNLNIV